MCWNKHLLLRLPLANGMFSSLCVKFWLSLRLETTAHLPEVMEKSYLACVVPVQASTETSRATDIPNTREGVRQQAAQGLQGDVDKRAQGPRTRINCA